MKKDEPRIKFRWPCPDGRVIEFLEGGTQRVIKTDKPNAAIVAVQEKEARREIRRAKRKARRAMRLKRKLK